MRYKKEFIIDAYLKNPNLDLKQFSEDNYIHYSTVTRTVNNLRKSTVTPYDIFCEKSLDLEGVYYLFSAGEEKKIELGAGRKIKNDVDLTHYEKYWLEINKRIYADR